MLMQKKTTTILEQSYLNIERVVSLLPPDDQYRIWRELTARAASNRDSVFDKMREEEFNNV